VKGGAFRRRTPYAISLSDVQEAGDYMTNVTVLLINHDSVFFDGVGSPFEALPRFGISRDQNAYKCERGCLTFHSMLAGVTDA
jgi:hypothetical protein